MRRKRDHRGRRLVFKLGLAAVAVVALWIAGLFQFVSLVPKQAVDTVTRTDAIVVLTGGSRRLGEGLELLSRGLAEKLFVSGVYQGIDVRELLQIVRRNPQELETQISIGNATNTAENALETMDWMQARDYGSLRLVTAAYHMPRSLLEFRNAMPGVTLVAHPVFPENVKQDRWWAWPGTANLMVSEYNKFLFAWLRHWGELILDNSGPGPGRENSPGKS